MKKLLKPNHFLNVCAYVENFVYFDQMMNNQSVHPDSDHQVAALEQ